jgi:hypothetical protein
MKITTHISQLHDQKNKIVCFYNNLGISKIYFLSFYCPKDTNQFIKMFQKLIEIWPKNMRRFGDLEMCQKSHK